MTCEEMLGEFYHLEDTEVSIMAGARAGDYLLRPGAKRHVTNNSCP